MKIKRKLLIALLSMACVTASAVALSACNNPEADTRDPAIVAVYNQYASAVENPLSYDEWLASIKGATGPKGETGKSAYELYLESLTGNQVPLSEADWIASLKGESGKGVQKVELNADGTKLVIIYTDGSSEEVDLPDEFHKHTYGATVTLIEPTNETEGLGIKVCSEDGHTEVVAIPKLAYTLKFKYADGTPAANLSVGLYSGSTEADGGTTDENGEVVLNHFGPKGNYTVRLADSNLATLGTVTTGDAESYVITVAKSAENGISEDGYYAVTVSWESGTGIDDYPGYTELELNADAEKDTHFKLSVDEDFGDWRFNDNSMTLYSGSVYEVNVPAGGYRSIYYSFDGVYYDKETYPEVSYLIKAELTDAPARGADLDIPLVLALNDNNVTIETEDKVAYLTLSGSLLGDADYAKLTFGEGVTVQLYVAQDMWGDTTAAPLNQITAGNFTLVNCTSGENTPYPLNQYGDNYFKVTTTAADGNAAIKVEKGYALGNKLNPFPSAAVGTTTVIPANGMSAYAAFTPEETKMYTISFAVGSELNIWDSKNSYCGFAGEGGKVSLEMTAGSTYYLEIYFSSDMETGELKPAEYLIKEYDAASDGGYSYKMPRVLELTDNQVQTVVVSPSNEMFFKVNLPAGLGRLNVKVVNSKGEEMITTDPYGGSIYYVTPIVYLEDNSEWFSRDDGSLYKNGGAATIKVGLNLPWWGGDVGYDGSYTVKFEYVPIVPVDHTFTVKSGDTLISGVTVELYELGAAEDAGPVATGTTDNNGVATINVLPGEYKVSLSGLDTAYVYETTVYTTLPNDGSKDLGADYVVEVLSKISYKYTAKYSDGSPVTGLTVTLTLSGGETVTATTGDDGVATFAPMYPENCTVAFSGYDADAYKVGVDEFDAMTFEYDVTLLGKVNYTVTVNDIDGNALEGVIVTIKDAYGNIATGTTAADGKVTMEDKLFEGANNITCSGAVPSGYIISGETVLGETEVTLTAAVLVATVYTGGDITLTAEATYYIVDASAAGSHSIYPCSPDSAVIYLNGELLVFGSGGGCTVTFNEGDILMVYTSQPMGNYLDDVYIY